MWCSSWHLGIIQTWYSYSFDVRSACNVSFWEEDEIPVVWWKTFTMTVYCSYIWGRTGWSSLFIYPCSCWFDCCILLDVFHWKVFMFCACKCSFYKCSYSRWAIIYMLFSISATFVWESGIADAVTLHRWMEMAATSCIPVRGGNGCFWVYIITAWLHTSTVTSLYTTQICTSTRVCMCACACWVIACQDWQLAKPY